MKLICNGNDLSDAVGKVYKAVSARTTNPILEGIKLSAKEDSLTLSATDLEISIEKIIPADVKIPGEVVVPGLVISVCSIEGTDCVTALVSGVVSPV